MRNKAVSCRCYELFHCMNSRLENKRSIIDAKSEDNVKPSDYTALAI